jgi:hypothetical protein
MIDRGDDKAGIGQRLCRVMICAEPPGATVGENNQRQLCSRDGTILHANQAEIGGHRQLAQRDVLRLAFAWIPDGACQAWIGIVKLDTRRVRGRVQTAQEADKSQKRPEQQSSHQSSEWN